MATKLQQIINTVVDAVQSGGFSSGSAKTPASQGGGTKNGGGSNTSTASKPKSTSSKATSYSYTGKSTSTTKKSTTGSGGTSGDSSKKASAGEQALADYAVQSAVERARQRVDEATKAEPQKSYGFDALNAEVKAAQGKAKSAETNYLATLEKFNYNAGAPEVKSAQQVLDDALREAKIFTAAAEKGAQIKDRRDNVLSGAVKQTASGMVNAAGTAYESGVRGAEAQRERELAELQAQRDKALENYEAVVAKYGEGNANTEAAKANLNDKQNMINIYEGIKSDSLYDVSEKIYGAADKLAESGAEDIAQAKEGLGKGGQFAVDVGVAGAQLLGDLALGGTVPLAVRAFGGASGQARREGAAYEEQVGYGAASAALELVTEKIFGGDAGVYGKGFAGNVIEKVLGKLQTTPTGKAALRVLGQMGQEGFEEVISSVGSTLLQGIYNDKSLGENWDEVERADVLYDALIGAVLGGAGAVVSTNTKPLTGVEAMLRGTADGEVESYTPEAQTSAVEVRQEAVDYINEVLNRGRINNTAANNIINTPELTAAFNQVFSQTPLQGTVEQRRETLRNAVRAKGASEAAVKEAEVGLELAGNKGIDPLTRNAIYVRDIILNGANTQTANEILNTPELKAMWERMTGKTLPSNPKSAIKMIIQTKRKAMDYYEAETEAPLSNVQPAPPETAAAKFTAVVNRPSDQVSQSTIPSTPVVNTQNEDFLQASESANNTVSGAGGEITPNAQQSSEIGAPVEFNATTVQNGTTVPTQSKYLEDMLTEEERKIQGLTEEDFTHEQRHDATVAAEAERRIVLEGSEKVRDFLIRKGAGKWNDTDVVTAQKILKAEVAKARGLSGDEAAKAYAKIAKLAKAYRNSGTEQGRALRQRRGFDVSVEGIASAASEILFGDNTSARKGLSDEKKVQVTKQVVDLATRYNNLAPGDTGGLVELVKAVSVARHTTGFLSKENSKAVNFALNEVLKQDGGEAFLKGLAATQIKSIASDYMRPGIINQIKSIRFMNMLSNAATGTTNLASNFTFGSFMESLSSDFSLPFDMLMSVATGKREVAGELGAFSATKWQGAYDAAIRSFLEVSLDAETDQATYGYKELKGRTFKMTGNAFERFLSRMEQLQGYALKTSDQAAKGGAAAMTKEGLGKLAAKGKAKSEDIEVLASQVADYRTLQTNSKVAAATNKIRDALDVLHIGNEKTGTYGVGSDIMPFAQVPANSVLNIMSYNPAVGAPVALYRTAKTISDAKNGTLKPGQQADAARAWGRIGTGTAVIALAASMAAKGLIQDFEDEDKDVTAQRKAEGRSGLQWNISATLRDMAGGSAAPEPEDVWVDFSWMPVLNSLMNMGADVYESIQDDGKLDIAEVGASSWDSMVDAILEFPAVSKISQIVNTVKYSETEGWGKAAELATTSVADTVSSIAIPNAVRAIAAGLDPYERDTYNSDSYIQDIINNAVSGVPFLRQTSLEPKLDNFGNPVKNEGGALNFLDRVFFPGNYSVHNQSEASKIVEDIYAQTGDASVMPDRNAPYKVEIDGEEIELSEEERRAYKESYGQMVEDLVFDSTSVPMFDVITPTQQSDVLGDILSFSKDQAKVEVAENNGKEYKSKWSDEAKLPDVASYFVSKTAYTDAINKDNPNPNYDAVDALLANIGSIDRATRDKLDEQSGFENLRFAYDMFGMDSETAITNRNMISETQKTSLGGKDGGSADMAAIAKNVKGSDADKLAVLEVANTPDAKTGKREAIVRRTEAAMAQGIPFDDWAKIETYITDAGSTSRATIMAAGEKYGYKGYEVYNIYKKVYADDEAVTQVNDYFSKDYIAPDKVSLSEYLTGEEVDETDKASSGSGGRGGYGGRYRGGSSKPANLGNSVGAVKSIANSGTTSNSSKYMRQALNDVIAQSKKQQATQPTVKWEDLLAGYVKGIK